LRRQKFIEATKPGIASRVGFQRLAAWLRPRICLLPLRPGVWRIRAFCGVLHFYSFRARNVSFGKNRVSAINSIVGDKVTAEGSFA
jgi:hypothetical protein